MSNNRMRSDGLRRFLQRMELTSPADERLYLASRDLIIDRAVDYFRSPEFSELTFRTVKNDAFLYIIFYLKGKRPLLFENYGITLYSFNSELNLTYTAYQKKCARRRDSKSTGYKLVRRTFSNVAGLFAHLEAVKAEIAEIAGAQNDSASLD